MQATRVSSRGNLKLLPNTQILTEELNDISLKGDQVGVVLVHQGWEKVTSVFLSLGLPKDRATEEAAKLIMKIC